MINGLPYYAFRDHQPRPPRRPPQFPLQDLFGIREGNGRAIRWGSTKWREGRGSPSGDPQEIPEVPTGRIPPREAEHVMAPKALVFGGSCNQYAGDLATSRVGIRTHRCHRRSAPGSHPRAHGGSEIRIDPWNFRILLTKWSHPLGGSWAAEDPAGNGDANLPQGGGTPGCIWRGSRGGSVSARSKRRRATAGSISPSKRHGAYPHRAHGTGYWTPQGGSGQSRWAHLLPLGRIVARRCPESDGQ